MGENAQHIMLLSRQEYYKRGWIFETGSSFVGDRDVGGRSFGGGGTLYIVGDPHSTAPDSAGRTLRFRTWFAALNHG